LFAPARSTTASRPFDRVPPGAVGGPEAPPIDGSTDDDADRRKRSEARRVPFSSILWKSMSGENLPRELSTRPVAGESPEHNPSSPPMNHGCRPQEPIRPGSPGKTGFQPVARRPRRSLVGRSIERRGPISRLRPRTQGDRRGCLFFPSTGRDARLPARPRMALYSQYTRDTILFDSRTAFSSIHCASAASGG
jgi:hypothetical protein